MGPNRSAAILDLLVDPAVAFALHPPDPLAPDARLAHTACEWDTLASVYKRAGEAAWKGRQRDQALRLLLAESRTALRLPDRNRYREAVAFLASRHRLCAGFVAAEHWYLEVLRESLDESTAPLHARMWREMAALHEVAGRYAEGRITCDRAIAVCVRYQHAAAIRDPHIKALLQRAVLERQQGDLAAARGTLDHARELADHDEVHSFTQGLVALREGGLEVVLGRPDVALDAFHRAADAFEGLSEANVATVRLREVFCLRALGRRHEALAITDELATRFRGASGSAYHRGQVMLERAEVLEELGDHDGVAVALAEVEAYYASSTTLESVRWHRHVARNLIHREGDPTAAAGHLAAALEIATRPDRADLTRTRLALHDLLRLRTTDALPHGMWRDVWRAALLAADIQRDSLDDPASRWSLHGESEPVYATSVLISTELAEAASTAQIAETGRADVLNHLLGTSSGKKEVTIESGRLEPAGQDPELVHRIVEVGRLAAEAIRSGRRPEVFPELPLPGSLPSTHELDTMADLIVMITIGESREGWWSATVTRERHGDWQAVVNHAEPELTPLVDRLAGGRLLPPRGVTHDLVERLGRFLLPEPGIWAGSADTPGR
ncbi:tetratricopeptide repeat protein [Actinoplanes sp. CA-252034]|uniref:tetratricopeptide repeat protein n=1 Tax=Actinoplanes sp. CA-252034 TaxID=3239906 RepID=UPI003D96B900